MNDFLITMAVSVLIELARDPKGRGKWRKALLKVFTVIATAFRSDAEFQHAFEEVQK